MKSILITRGCGFVGSNLAMLFRQKYPDYKIICLDNLKRRGSELNIPRLLEYGIQYIHGDIRNREDLKGIKELNCIIDASAEPSVLAGQEGNTDFLINTNLKGTVNCLNIAVKNKADFIYLSTSRVYPVKNVEQINFIENDTRFEISDLQNLTGVSKKGISEDFPLQGYRSIYGATKLSSELIIEEFREIYGLNTVVNRCGVVAGPYQMGKIDQGVAALWVASHFWKRDLAYIGYGGTGKQVRDILNINDLFELVDLQIHNISKHNGLVYNVGGGRFNVSLMELTDICEEITGNKISIRNNPENRKADVRIYITDHSKISGTSGWQPGTTVKKTVLQIFQWIKSDECRLKVIF